MFARKPSLRVPVYSNVNRAHLVGAVVADDERRPAREPQVARLRSRRERLRLPRFEVGADGAAAAQVLGKRCPVVHDAALREPVAEEVLLGIERPGVVVARAADLRIDGEGDLDVVAQIGVAFGAADLAEEMGRGRRERRQALDDLTAARAYVLPLHRDEAFLPRVQEEVNRLAFVRSVLLGESHRVDAHELAVVRRAGEIKEQLVRALRQATRLCANRVPIQEHRMVEPHDGLYGEHVAEG